METFKIKTTLSRVFKKHKLILRSIAVTLVLVLLFTSMPLDGFAALAEQWVEDSKLITIEKELEQYRTEFSKTYLKSDGSLESVVSSNPIHFKEDGEWVEIDSSLEADENEKGTEILKNKKGSFNVELPTEIEKDSEIAIEKGKNKISIKLLETKSSKAKKNKDKKEKAEKLTKAQRKRMTAGELFEADNNQTSAVEYNAVYNDTNVRYDVTPNEVKESIVLQKAPNKKATYSYEITADGLTAVLNKDNSIDFYEGAKTENATPVFSMPAPHMFDSNGEYSYDIATTLENKKGKYILTYKPSYEWLKNKNRAYPVTVDPTVVVNSGIQDSYTFSGEGHRDSYTGYEQQLKVGTTAWIAPNDYWQTYLKFTDLPQIPYEDYRIDSAYLMLTPKATTGSWQEMELGVYELTEDWKNHQTGKVAERITFNNAPEDAGYSTATATVARGGADNGVGVGFEIAHIMEKWYENPEENFGIKLAAHLEENQYNDNLVFHSSRSTTGTAPYLSLTYTEYVPVTGIEIINRPENDRWQVGYYMPVLELNAIVYPENATNKEIIWENSNPAVGNIEVFGSVHFAPASLGVTTITAKSADNNEIIDSFELEVYNIPIETITITNRPENDTLESGSTHQLGFEVGPDNASDKSFVENQMGIVDWYSSDSNILSVDYSGVITANSSGTAVITAVYGDITNYFTLTVKDPICDEVELLYIGDTVVLFEHEQYYFSAEAKYQQNSVNAHLTYSSNNTNVVSFLEGSTMVANSVGTAIITVSVTDHPEVFKNIAVTVIPIQSAEITNLPENNSIDLLNKNHRLELEITTENFISTENDPVHGGRFFKFFEWSSSNPNIATIDSQGYVWPHAVGTTVITVRRPNGGEVLDSFTLNINSIKAADVWPYIQPVYNPMFVGESWCFEGYVEPENTTVKRTVCISSNPSVVSVESRDVADSDFTQHTITALAEGSAIIRLEAYDDSAVYFEFVVDVSTFDKEIGLNLPYDNVLYTDQVWQISTNPNATVYVDGETLVDMGNGYIKAVKAGTTSFSIYARDNTEYFVCREITVIQLIDLEITDIPSIGEKGSENEFNGIYIGLEYRGLGVKATPEMDGEIKWYSSNENIVKVIDNGFYGIKLLGVALGEATICVEFNGENAYGIKEFKLKVVDVPVTNLGIDAVQENIADGELILGEKGKLQVDVYPKNPPANYDVVEWSVSGDINCVKLQKISKDIVVVEAIGSGVVEINAKINGVTATSAFKVTVKAPSSIITVPNSGIIKTGNQYTFNYDISLNATDIIWISNKKNIANFENSQSPILSTYSNGEVIITLQYKVGTQTFSHSIDLLISNVIITDVPGNRVLFVDGKKTLNAMVYLNNTTSSDIVWTTSNSSVAAVDSDGEITGIKAGKVTIIAKYKHDTSQKAWVTITVKKTKSYYYYLDEEGMGGNHKRLVRANVEKDVIANSYYGGKDSYVDTIELTSKEAFKCSWNNFGKDGYDVGYVIIDCHGNEDGFGHSNSKVNFFVDCKFVSSIEYKEMQGLIILVCSAGNLETLNSYNENLTSAFAKKLAGIPVIASDATVWCARFENETEYENLSTFDNLEGDTPIVSNKATVGWLIYLYRLDKLTIYKANQKETKRNGKKYTTMLYMSDLLAEVTSYPNRDIYAVIEERSLL